MEKLLCEGRRDKRDMGKTFALAWKRKEEEER